MLQNIIITFFLLLLSGLFTLVFGQATGSPAKPSIIAGDVVSVDQAKITIKTADGQVDAILGEKTEFKRVPAANPTLQSATPAELTDISVGDKVMATGILAADRKSVPARTVYLMTKSDIMQKQAKEAQLWRTKGIAGKVTKVNAQTSQITVEISGLTGMTSMTLTPKADAIYHRYIQDSVRFDEAKESMFSEIRDGDMIRALGDKSADGTSFSAEEIVTGSFQTIAGTVKTIDIEKKEIVVTNLQTNKEVTIVLKGTSVMKKYPAEMAERLAGFQTGGARPPGQAGAQGQARPGGQGQGGAQGQVRPGGQGQPGGNIDDMLDRFPNITAADLKEGDMIAVSSSKNGDVTRVNAIKLLAGVEPFIRMAQAAAVRSGRRGGSVGNDFSIPGLDGIGFP